MAPGRIDPEGGFRVIRSRCSFEMVQKAATIGIPLLVAISALRLAAAEPDPFDLAQGGVTEPASS
jgi:formate dehydrogenase assembly factor FdhD